MREVLYPVVGEQTLTDLVREAKATGPTYRTTLARHDPQFLPRPLPPGGAGPARRLDFRSNNEAHRPVIRALDLVRRYAGTQAARLSRPTRTCR